MKKEKKVTLKFLFILLQFRDDNFELFLTLIGIILFYQSDKRVVYTRISWLGRKSYSRSCKDRLPIPVNYI